MVSSDTFSKGTSGKVETKGNVLNTDGKVTSN